MARELQLPHALVSRGDVGRLIRELQALNEAVRQNTVRGGEKLLPTSRLLDELAEQNKLNLLQSEDRQMVHDFLADLRDQAPLLHFSFSSDPSPRFLASLISWLRKEVHPLALVQIGLEPSLGVGCILRTTNHSFDLSLRRHFDKQRELLMAKIKEGEP